MKLIGIPISASKTQYYINQAYVDYVSEAGMTPVLLAPDKNNDAADVVLEACDGLLLPGGSDLEPTHYGEDNIASYGVDLDKDDFERLLYYKFVAAEKPVFGICRGFQLIMREMIAANDDLGRRFTYFQHIGEHSIASDLNIPRTVTSHSVDIKNSLYGKNEKGEGTIFVNSMHHQGIVIAKSIKPNNKVEILATTDKGMSRKEVINFTIVEAVRINKNVLAVQWHPEELRDYALIQNFFGVNEEDQKAKEVAK